MRTMFPSGSATLVWPSRAGHPGATPDAAVWFVQAVPLSVDRHVSFNKFPSLSVPPMSTKLPSGSAALLCHILDVHPALAFASVHA